MRDDELATLLRSPSLALEPPADLLEGARSGARRVRRRQRAGLAGAAALLVATAALGGAGLAGDRGDRPPDVATEQLQELFPDATTQVVPLARIRGGTVYTYFRGSQWCTVSRRTGPPNSTCAGSLPASGVRPFAFLRGPGTESLAVDQDHLVAGILGDGISAVEVELADGRVLEAALARGQGFPRPVWWVQLGPEDRVTGYTASEPGRELTHTLLPSQDEPFVIPATPG